MRPSSAVFQSLLEADQAPQEFPPLQPEALEKADVLLESDHP
ncbi:MAG TPA: hypothetical protein VFS50_15215 [Meiothermus sp.]|nr:hypothetical protein [Meiothermus sp.]